jgi:hypothetical protein
MRKAAAVIATLILCSCLAFGEKHRSHHKSSSSDAGKTEHVSGYTTKKGTEVHSYDRHPAGTAPKKHKHKK